LVRKLAIGVLAVVILLVAAVAFVPRVVDWHLFDDQIAQAVRDATGREIRIDGDIDVALIPAITLTARDVRLANPSGTLADVLILASIFPRQDVRDFSVRRVLRRVEVGELRPREAALLLTAQYEMPEEQA
jgi:hypothetical protein